MILLKAFAKHNICSISNENWYNQVASRAGPSLYQTTDATDARFQIIYIRRDYAGWD